MMLVCCVLSSKNCLWAPVSSWLYLCIYILNIKTLWRVQLGLWDLVMDISCLFSYNSSLKQYLTEFIMKDITSCSPSFYRNLPHAITYDRMTGYMRLNHFWHLPSCKSSWYIMNSSAAQVLKCKSVMGQCELDWFVKYPDGPRPPESVSNNFPEISNFIVCD